jgi:hypothetical protein
MREKRLTTPFHPPGQVPFKRVPFSQLKLVRELARLALDNREQVGPDASPPLHLCTSVLGSDNVRRNGRVKDLPSLVSQTC